MKKKAVVLWIGLLMLFSFIVIIVEIALLAKASIIYVDDSGGADYLTIQEGIDAANPGDTVFVYNGTYYENVWVDKSINLTGEDRENTILDGGGNGDVMNVSANWVNVSGFTLRNSGNRGGPYYDAGITLYQVNNCSVVNINLSSDHLLCILLYSSSNNMISNNYASDCHYGIAIYLHLSSNNNIIANNIFSRNKDGIFLHQFSSHNRIYHNDIIKNKFDQAYDRSGDNFWNNSYPSGGNYWSDYTGMDVFSGPDQDRPGSDGIGDTPYVIYYHIQDYYPLMTPSSPTIPSAPQNIQVSTGDTYINITWNPPSLDGNSPITNYTIRRFEERPDKLSYTSKLSLFIEIGNVSYYNDTSTTYGVVYNYEITAKNANGEGHASYTSSIRFGTGATKTKDESPSLLWIIVSVGIAAILTALIFRFMAHRKKEKQLPSPLFDYEFGIFLCIFSVILITINFAFVPLYTWDRGTAIFHPLFPALIIGLALMGLALTFFHKRIGVRVGALGYFVPILILGPIYLSGFGPFIGIPEYPQYFKWEIGMHLVIAGLVLQYVGSLLTPLGKILLPPHKKRPNVVDSDVVIGYREVIIGMLKKFTNFLIVLTIILVTIFIVYTPLRALYLI